MLISRFAFVWVVFFLFVCFCLGFCFLSGFLESERYSAAYFPGVLSWYVYREGYQDELEWVCWRSFASSGGSVREERENKNFQATKLGVRLGVGGC